MAYKRSRTGSKLKRRSSGPRRSKRRTIKSRYAGRFANKGLRYLRGKGDYTMSGGQNISKLGQQVPIISNNASAHGVTIRHREYVSDIFAPGPNFVNTTFRLNPGDQATFPWLSQIAYAFEEYTFEGLVFEYRSTSGDALNSTNTALGSIYMATDYDVTDEPFTTKQQMASTEFCTIGKPCDNLLHTVETAKNLTVLPHRYIRVNSTTSTDARFEDLGRFQIAVSQTQAAGYVAGELWVSYQVTLMKPIMEWTTPFLKYRCSVANINNNYVLGDPAGYTPSVVFDARSNKIFQVSRAAKTIYLPKNSVGSRYRITWKVNSDGGGHTSSFQYPSLTFNQCHQISAGTSAGALGSKWVAPGFAGTATSVIDANTYAMEFTVESTGNLPNVVFSNWANPPYTGSSAVVDVCVEEIYEGDMVASYDSSKFTQEFGMNG